MEKLIDLDSLLNRVGKRIFVEYYYDFKALHLSRGMNSKLVAKMTEAFTEKSKMSRISKAKRIFSENLELKALQAIVNSSHPQVEPFRQKARLILEEERKGF